ncbi:deacylase [Desulfovibrio sp. OttesenSCG-928-O18]|nr:deacylase [Desulfovibrio sp. OttesenSCG-928-O18]
MRTLRPGSSLIRSLIFPALLFSLVLAPGTAPAETKQPRRVAVETDRPEIDFSFHRLGPGGGPTLLVVGGIQGDEPGGFSAAALLVTGYTIKSGQVWVVPNLNFPSIVKRNRGAFGDMNRKFAHVDPKDPDYAAVKSIQNIISAPEVDVILNLHDGSGFYRPQHEGPMHNPKRWGQCVIIDQDTLHSPADLETMALAAVRDANKRLLKDEHRYHMRNTETSKGDKEMEKTLSYFAVRKGKPAFGIEASKTFTTEFRTYYHIHILESFMRQMGIEFERGFELSPGGIKTAINSGVGMALYNNRIFLPLDNVRPALTFIPMKKNAPVDLKCSTPLLALLQEKNASWRVAYGNRTLTRLSPQYMEYDESLPSVEIVLDGKAQTVPVGRMITVSESFLIRSVNGYRVNAIGALREKADGSECNVVLRKKDFLPRYSVDKSATTYRVEIYKGKAFAGMILVRFGKALPASRETMTAVNGPESDFGF